VSDYSEEGDEVGAEGATDPNAPVLIFQAATNEEAEVVHATLEAAGIAAILQSNPINPYMGGMDVAMRDTSAMGIFVAPSQAEAARAVLSAPAPSEEELAAEAEADPKTLEEAEAEVRDARI
jgi:hypothetical protein